MVALKVSLTQVDASRRARPPMVTCRLRLKGDPTPLAAPFARLSVSLLGRVA